MDDTDGDYGGNDDVVGDDYRGNEGIINRHDYDAMRQCQIRVRFESGGMQFFKVLGKWFSKTKYLPIIVL